MRTIALYTAVLLSFSCRHLMGEDRFYAGVLGGIATLTGDASSSISPASAEASLYDPVNGPALNVFAGVAASDYVSVQLNYLRNSNRLTFFSTSAAGQTLDARQESRNSSQNAMTADFLLYFRKRSSEFRPYLSAGGGFVHLDSTLRNAVSTLGSPSALPQDFTATRAALRVAVGIDVRIRRGWSFRYSFSETTSSNPLSQQLSPPGAHALMNLQNLFGFLKNF